MHLLFPKQIPDTHLVTSKPNTITIDRVVGRELDSFDEESGDVDDIDTREEGF